MRSSGSSCAISASIAAHTGTTSAPSSTARFSTASRYGLSLKPFSATLATYISGLAVIRQYSRSSGRSVGVQLERARRLALVEVLAHALQQLALADRVLVAGLRRLLGAQQAALDGLEVGQRQLGVDHLDVGAADRSCPATCTMSSLTKQRTTCAMASVSRMCARNLLPRPSPFEAPATRPAMSTNSTVVGRTFSGFTMSASAFEAQVRHRHHAHVRVDGAERIVGRRGVLRLRDRVEERGLADVRQADDAAFDAQGEGCSGESRVWGAMISGSRAREASTTDATSYPYRRSRVTCLVCSCFMAFSAPSRTNTVSASSDALRLATIASSSAGAARCST